MSHQLKGGPANIRTGSRQQCPRAAKCGNFTGVNADVKYVTQPHSTPLDEVTLFFAMSLLWF